MEAIVGCRDFEAFGVAFGSCSQRSDNVSGNAPTRRIAILPQHSQSVRQGLPPSLVTTSVQKRLRLASAVQDDRNTWGSDDGLGGNVEFQKELDRVMQEGDAPRLMEKLQTAEDRVLRAEVVPQFCNNCATTSWSAQIPRIPCEAVIGTSLLTGAFATGRVFLQKLEGLLALVQGNGML